MGLLPHLALTTLTATLVIACGGKQFDAEGSGSSGDDGGTPDAGSASGGRQGGAGGTSSGGSGGGAVRSGGAGPGGAGSGGIVTSTGGQPTGGGGAGGSTELHASDFDQACEFDGECTVVLEGDVCGCPGCPTAAIATSAVDAWTRARGAIVCEGPFPPCAEPLCTEILPACVGGKCTARQALYIDPTLYDSSCRGDSDCEVIQGGEVCSACKCGGTGVNKDAYEQYVRDIAEVQCTPGPSPCDCAIIDVAHCEPLIMGFEPGRCVVGP